MSADHDSDGPEFHGIKVKISQKIQGSLVDQISVSIYPNILNHETTPTVGNSYIFFVRNDEKQGFADPYTALKLLPATKENINMVIFSLLKARASAKLLEVEKDQK